MSVAKAGVLEHVVAHSSLPITFLVILRRATRCSTLEVQCTCLGTRGDPALIAGHVACCLLLLLPCRSAATSS